MAIQFPLHCLRAFVLVTLSIFILCSCSCHTTAWTLPSFSRRHGIVANNKNRNNNNAALFTSSTTLLDLDCAAPAPGQPEVLDVAIIGGGPTGLACALALLNTVESKTKTAAACSSSERITRSTKVAPSIAVFEADTFQPKGASIVISKPGWNALKAIDKITYTAAKADGVGVSSIYFEDFSGHSILPRPIKYLMTFLVRPVVRYLFRTGLVRSNSWHAFRMILRAGVERKGKELGCNVMMDHTQNLIRTNASLVSLDPTYKNNSRTLLTFADGSQVAASTVLACDGTFSTVRKCLEDSDGEDTNTVAVPAAPLVDMQKTVWRGTAPDIDTRGKGIFFVAQDQAKVTGGTGCLFPAGRNTPGSSLSIILPYNQTSRANGSEDARRRLTNALAELEVPIDRSLQDAIDNVEYMLEHKLHGRDFEVSPSLYSGYDRIAYVGDAAHPFRPTGEGTAMALEDAWAIGHVAATEKTNTAERSTRSILPCANLRLYERSRQDRVVAVSKAVQELAESYYEEKDNDEPSQQDIGTKKEKKKKKPAQTNKRGVDQAMKDHPIHLSAL